MLDGSLDPRPSLRALFVLVDDGTEDVVGVETFGEGPKVGWTVAVKG